MGWFDKVFKPLPSRFVCFAEGDGGGSASGGDAAAGGSPAPGNTPPGDSASGGSSSSVTPSPGAGEATSTPETNFSFDGLDSDLDEIEILEPSTTGTDPGATQTQEGTPKPQAELKTPAAEPAQQVPSQEPAKPSASGAQAPSAPLSKREELDEAIGGFKSGFDDLSKWAQGELFSLSEAELDQITTDAASAIPALMAKTYTRAVLASLNFIKNFVPEMIAQEHTRLNGVAKRTSEAEDQFWSAWPDLKRQEHGPLFAQVAKQYRALNPQASRQDAIKFVGQYMMTHLGIQPGVANRAVPKVQPFQPARPGGHTPNLAPAADPYAGMDQEFDEV